MSSNKIIRRKNFKASRNTFQNRIYVILTLIFKFSPLRNRRPSLNVSQRARKWNHRNSVRFDIVRSAYEVAWNCQYCGDVKGTHHLQFARGIAHVVQDGSRSSSKRNEIEFERRIHNSSWRVLRKTIVLFFIDMS